MPHANSEAGPSCSSSAGPEDLSVTGDDEVKVFRDEGPVDVEGDSEEADVQLKEDKDELKNAAEGDRSTGTHIPTVKSDADRPEPVPFFGESSDQRLAWFSVDDRQPRHPND
ncbi:unnamed protein product [Cyprideis torosa]|uniref:Uncharacterized protein n=1 Tax=Cyprideis torosa TaxID=163714 RepID=A0A7R8ZJV1_9CRUS|nr:unnamed protein product [Cyprideis torosa]CAG0880425.1 unnamed protein product [Cyprideis torosa]